MKVQFYHKR